MRNKYGVYACGFVAVACGMAAICPAGELVFAERGKAADCAVVAGENPSPCMRHAAEEFAKYVRQMTGVALPVVEESAADRPAVRLKSRGGKDRDAFRFKADGRDFTIEGDSDRAVLFGVYDFLENQCGCEWLSVSTEIVPSLDRIAVPDGFALERRPVFVNRECGWSEPYANPDFAAKLKLNGFRYARVYGPEQGGKPPAFDASLGICHTFMRILPPEKYFKNHPEWYAEVDGRRRGEGRVQLCLTNPEVLERTISYVKGRIKKNYPAVKCYGVSQSDTMGYCTCANCRAVDEREGSPSGTVISFVNKIADAVAKDYPDVLIETLAYMYSRPAPKTLKCRDNVMVTLCTDTCDLSRPLKGNRYRWRGQPPFAEDLAKWRSIAKHIYVWDYALNFRYLWHAYPSLQVLKPNYELFADCGVTHVYLEGGHHGPHSESSEIKLWLASHLMWDPYQPVEPLMERFLKGYFGAGAPFARRYYEEMAALQKDESKTPQMMWGTLVSPILTDGFFERAAGLWREAFAAVKGDAMRERNIRWAMDATDYTRIMRAKPETCAASPRFVELQSAAKRIVSDVLSEEWPEPRIFAEDTAVDRESRERMRRVAAMDAAKEKVRQADGRVETRHSLVEFAEGRTVTGNFGAIECNCPYRMDKKTPVVACANERVRLKPSPYQPQIPVPGPSTVVAVTDISPAGGKAVLRLRRHGMRGEEPVEFASEWSMGVAVFDTGLKASDRYAFDSIDFVTPDFKKRYEFKIYAIEGIAWTSKAEALGLEVETPGRLHTLDWRSSDEAVAVIGNRAEGPVSVQGELEVRDFYGRVFHVPVETRIAGHGSFKMRLPRSAGKVDAKGVWRVVARLRDGDGKTVLLEDRFAVLDEHPVTPKVPYGSFRMGIHCHSARALDADRELIHDAAVRMGAKIVRIDGVFSSRNVWSAKKNDFDFTAADSFLDGLERRGLAVDAIVTGSLFAHFTDDFCTRLAARYRDRIDYYEIGNEWDLLPADVLTPEKGVLRQKAAYAALKKGCPKARVATNGWAVEDSNGHANVTQKGFQETFMKEAAGFYDIHAMHLHFPFPDYVSRMERFLELRRKCEVAAPFLLNETALAVRYRGEEEVAENVWTKIIYGWAKGATDYIWYNMRASQFDPGGSYGVVSRNFRPRLTFAAFSAISATLGDHDFEKTLVEKDGRKMYRFRRRGGGEIVMAGWDAGALKPSMVTVDTDARVVFAADVMNNRRAVAVVDGRVRLEVSAAPQAWIFEGATRAEPDGGELQDTAKAPSRTILVSPVRPSYGWDMHLHKYAQVHEEYPADPATAHRTWKGPDDLSGILLFSCDATNAYVLVSVKDEIDTSGDRVEIWRDGRNVTDGLGLVRVRHGDRRTTYKAVWPDRRPCRVNVRFIDDDGHGGVDGWMDYVPFDHARLDVLQWPVVRWSTGNNKKD